MSEPPFLPIVSTALDSARQAEGHVIAPNLTEEQRAAMTICGCDLIQALPEEQFRMFLSFVLEVMRTTVTEDRQRVEARLWGHIEGAARMLSLGNAASALDYLETVLKQRRSQ